MKNVICMTCGLEIEGSGDQKTGRPRQHHDDCRKLNNAISLLENRIETFRAMNPTTEKKKRLRSTLFSLTNLMNGK